MRAILQLSSPPPHHRFWCGYRNAYIASVAPSPRPPQWRRISALSHTYIIIIYIIYIYIYGCKLVSRWWLKYKTRVYVCVCIYIPTVYRGEKRIYPAAAGRLSFRIVLRHMRWRMIYMHEKCCPIRKRKPSEYNLFSVACVVRPADNPYYTIRQASNIIIIIIIYGRPRRAMYIIICE